MRRPSGSSRTVRSMRKSAERRVTLSITSAEAQRLPEPEQGPKEYRADPGAGRLARLFGGGWRRH